MVTANVMGASGYIGGELLRLLLDHPQVELRGASSRSRRGRPLHSAHPNLRGSTSLSFVDPDDLPESDVLFTALPHGEAGRRVDELVGRSPIYVDLSSDFRLRDAEAHRVHYGDTHAGEIVEQFVPGIPELHRAQLRGASWISAAGCMATAGILAMHPPAADELIEASDEAPVDLDARTGSSGAGAAAGPANLHAERSGAFRIFAPFAHRHAAEVTQATGLATRMTATGVEAVRGAQVVCRAVLRPGVDERAVRRSYARHYGEEAFVRMLSRRSGTGGLPEPKILSGTNFCDVGFTVNGRDALLVAALDNLVKGGAGAAVQSLNIRMGFPETSGLTFTGLHP